MSEGARSPGPPAPASSPKTKRCCARRWSTQLGRGLAATARSSPSARTAPARWRRLAEHRPDVAFLDIRMPGLSGLEVAAAAAEASPRTQIVFVTAYDQYAIDAFERGAIDYLLKPITPERLAATVQRLQARSRQQRCRRAGRTARTPRRHPAARRRAAAADLDHRQRRPRDPPDPGRRRRLFPRRQQVHDGDDRRRRGAAAHADPRAAHRARPDHVQADPPLDHRQPQGHRRHRPRRQRPRHRPPEVPARNPDRQRSRSWRCSATCDRHASRVPDSLAAGSAHCSAIAAATSRCHVSANSSPCAISCSRCSAATSAAARSSPAPSSTARRALQQGTRCRPASPASNACAVPAGSATTRCCRAHARQPAWPRAPLPTSARPNRSNTSPWPPATAAKSSACPRSSMSASVRAASRRRPDACGRLLPKRKAGEHLHGPARESGEAVALSSAWVRRF